MLIKMRKFLQAATDLYDTLDEDIEDKRWAADTIDYPFDVSFEEIVHDIRNWVSSAEEDLKAEGRVFYGMFSKIENSHLNDLFEDNWFFKIIVLKDCALVYEACRRGNNSHLISLRDLDHFNAIPKSLYDLYEDISARNENVELVIKTAYEIIERRK